MGKVKTWVLGLRGDGMVWYGMAGSGLRVLLLGPGRNGSDTALLKGRGAIGGKKCDVIRH